MVDLDSDPDQAPRGHRDAAQQLLITRGSITTFSIANDVAKVFRDPAGHVRGRLPGAGALNITGPLHAQSAILSAVNLQPRSSSCAHPGSPCEASASGRGRRALLLQRKTLPHLIGPRWKKIHSPRVF